MLPQEKVKNLIDRHLELEKELSSGDIDKKEGLSFSNAVLRRFNSPFLEL